jgi:hypothetical protein
MAARTSAAEQAARPSADTAARTSTGGCGGAASSKHGKARTRWRGRARASTGGRNGAGRTAERGHGGADECCRARAARPSGARRRGRAVPARVGTDARTVREGAGRAAERGQAGPAWAQRRGRVPASAGGPPSIETGGFFTAAFSSFLPTSLRASTPFSSEETVSSNFILFLHGLSCHVRFLLSW